jgi:hypothetical protein
MAPGEQKKHTQRLELEQNNQKNQPRNTLNQETPGFSAACKAQHCFRGATRLKSCPDTKPIFLAAYKVVKRVANYGTGLAVP